MRREPLWNLLVASALVVVTVSAYSPALSGEFVWDDDDYVSENVTLRSQDGLRAMWLDPKATPQYYPLVFSSFWLEYRLWELDSTGYHLTNLALHLTSALLLWRIAVLLAIPGAWVVAAIFAVHPAHVESVAWITERKNVLSGVFYLAAMLAYLHVALRPEHGHGRRRVLYVTSLALFLCALLSKTVTASLPAVLLLLVGWKRGRVGLGDARPLLPFFVVGALMGALTIWLEKTHVGAAGVDWQLTPMDRVIIAGRALWFYAGTLVWPVNLAFMYPRWTIDARSAAQLAYPVAAIVAVVTLWFARGAVGNGPLVAVLSFVITLVPALGFFDVFPMRYTFVADHYQYLASIALIALVVGVVARAVQGRTPVAVQYGGSALVVVLLAAMTWWQSHVFVSHESLWRDTVSKVPSSWMGHLSLGALLERRGALAEAEAHYRDAVRLNPEFGIARINLGALLANQGRLEEAILHMREAVRLEPDRRDVHVSLGRALLYVGRPNEAAGPLREAVNRWSDDGDARALLEQAVRAARDPAVRSEPVPGGSPPPRG